jgi:hypothetical protein
MILNPETDHLSEDLYNFTQNHQAMWDLKIGCDHFHNFPIHHWPCFFHLTLYNLCDEMFLGDETHWCTLACEIKFWSMPVAGHLKISLHLIAVKPYNFI